jgi:hypothetical protein
MEKKRGRLSPQDKDFILSQSAAGIDPVRIAEDLNRTVPMIIEFIKNNQQEPATAIVTEEGQISDELRRSEAWRNLKKEFLDDELRFFEETYIKLMKQFGAGVLASETMQIFQAVKFEILMSRNLRERRRCRQEIEETEDLEADFMKSIGYDKMAMTDAQAANYKQLMLQLRNLRDDELTKTNEYVKLQERLDALIRALKGTRDQRVKEIEKTDVNFLSVIKSLSRRDQQERADREMELMKLSGAEAYKRLGMAHKFADGNEDSPILCADTVTFGDEPK